MTFSMYVSCPGDDSNKTAGLLAVFLARDFLEGLSWSKAGSFFFFFVFLSPSAASPYDSGVSVRTEKASFQGDLPGWWLLRSTQRDL